MGIRQGAKQVVLFAAALSASAPSIADDVMLQQQLTTPGTYGTIASTFLQSMIIGSFIPATVKS